MKDMTIAQFCRKFDACQSGKDWAYSLSPKKSKAMCSDVFERMADNPEYGLWAITREGLYTEKQFRLSACRIVRELVWDKLTDERSKNAVVVSEKYANGKASHEELSAARSAAIKIIMENGNPFTTEQL